MAFRRIFAVTAILAAAPTACGQDVENSVPRVRITDGQNFEAATISEQRIGEGLYVLRTEGGPTVGNMLVSIGEDGVLLVDDQMTGIEPRYRARIAALGGSAIDFVVNTHWHYDHSNANQLLGSEGTRFVAHENSRTMMMRDNTINVVNQLIEQDAYNEQGLPVMTYTRSMRMHFNGHGIRLLHFGSAHTAGDTAVIFPGLNLAHMGDVFNTSGFPFIDADNGGSLDGVIAFSEAVLDELQPGATVIPGHGEVSDYATLDRYVEMLKDVRNSIAELIADGATLDQVIAAQPLRDWDDEFGDQTRTVDRIRMIDRAYASLSR